MVTERPKKDKRTTKEKGRRYKEGGQEHCPSFLFALLPTTFVIPA